jgi:hypothetical protein
VEGAVAAINFHGSCTSPLAQLLLMLVSTGTGVTVMGGRRAGYGPFSVTLDDQIIASGAANGAADSTQQILATVSGLALGDHRLVLTNTGTDGALLDIDSVIVADQLGVAG